MGDCESPEGHLPSDLREMVENLAKPAASSTGTGSSSQQPAWYLSAPPAQRSSLAAGASPAANSARSSPAQHGGRHPWLLPRRASSRSQQLQRQQQQTNISDWDNGHHGAQSPPPTSLFSAQTRSIFASGPPTASVSANTAQASMSSPPSFADSPNALYTLGAAGSFSFRRAAPHSSSSVQLPLPVRSLRLAGIEKETDDPSSTSRRMATTRSDRSTPAAVSSLFTTPDPTSPPGSRQASYRRSGGGQYGRGGSAETAPLPNHLYTRGLLSGRHSDITVVAFGTRYPLHRLLLDRAPYFSSALSEPWMESSAKEITLHPEAIDSNITQGAFELALKRIYGCHKEEEEDKEAIGLFATGCWLEMADLIEASLSSLMRQLCAANVSTYIRLVTNNYYGRHGDRILAAAKAMLCRDGWEMPLRCFDGISGDIIREIVGSDGFYVHSEWDRFIMAKRLVDRRLRDAAFEAGLVDAHGKQLVPMPRSLAAAAPRFEAASRPGTSDGGPDINDRWLAPYMSPDIAPILTLLDEGLYYVHMSFEHLQKIKASKDVLGLPLLPEKVVADALWMSMELRQRVLNANETDLELGITECLEDPANDGENESESTTSDTTPDGNPASTVLGKQPERGRDEESQADGDGGDGAARKYWVPLVDATYPLGGDLEPTAVADGAGTYKHRHQPHGAGSVDMHDAHWAADFASALQDRPDTPPDVASGPSPKLRHSAFPPFRFSVEFPAAKNLKEKKRTYSPNVWYAGNLWNVYVQKTVGTRHTQLGVYLHRDKHDAIFTGDDSGSLPKALNLSVDERIDQLEREMVQGRGLTARRSQGDGGGGGGGRTEDNGEEFEAVRTAAAASRPAQDLSTLSGLVRSSRGVTKSSEATGLRSSLPGGHELAMAPAPPDEGGPGDSGSRQYRISEAFPFEKPRPRVATMPAYVDGRATARTYHRIYSPSRSGRVLTVYESGPDKFNVSQSWGWKSSNLILDDALGEDEADEQARDTRLRFMVVIGNV